MTRPGCVGSRYDEGMADVAVPAQEPLSGPMGQRVAARRGEILDVLRRHGVTNPEIFGSAARGDDHEGSDVDLLVDFAPGTDIIDIIGIKRELENVLEVPVDVVPRNGLKERVRSRAARDLLPL
ncbi:MAG: nucleotidyltransferase family protein [Dermatophilaceae bacterium]